jgi:hypothetical protein
MHYKSTIQMNQQSAITNQASAINKSRVTMKNKSSQPTLIKEIILDDLSKSGATSYVTADRTMPTITCMHFTDTNKWFWNTEKMLGAYVSRM